VKCLTSACEEHFPPCSGLIVYVRLLRVGNEIMKLSAACCSSPLPPPAAAATRRRSEPSSHTHLHTSPPRGRPIKIGIKISQTKIENNLRTLETQFPRCRTLVTRKRFKIVLKDTKYWGNAIYSWLKRILCGQSFVICGSS